MAEKGSANRAPLFLCVPSMGTDLEVRVHWEVDRNDPSEPQGDERERVAERSGVARPAGRRTEIGYEAWPTRASGPKTAKLSRSTVRLCRSGACAGTVSVSYLGRSRLTPERVTVPQPEREVSRGRSSGELRGSMDRLDAKGRTERRANQS